MKRTALLSVAGLLVGCASTETGDALARLSSENGPTATVVARELLVPDAQRFMVVCPGIPADTVAELAGDSVKVPTDGYDDVMNSFVSVASDGGVVTQRYAREEIDLCAGDDTRQLEMTDASANLTFVKQGTRWQLLS